MAFTFRTAWKGLTALSVMVVAGCAEVVVPPPTGQLAPSPVVEKAILDTKANSEFLIQMNTGSYCRAGQFWGEKLRNQMGALYGKKPNDMSFVSFLRTGKEASLKMKTPSGRFYFGVDETLRQKFNDCFRTAYGRLDAIKVLGQHVATAAGQVGSEVGASFAKWPMAFFGVNLPKTVAIPHRGPFVNMDQMIHADAVDKLDFFKQLMTVGSHADRQAFKTGFVCTYRKTMQDTLALLKKKIPFLETKYKPGERLLKPVVCDRPHLEGQLVIYNRDSEFYNISKLPGRFYANHPDIDKLGYRIFSGEELYLRYYHRSLNEVGRFLGKSLYHNLMTRAEGLEFVRLLGLAVERPQDIVDYFGPGFVETFDNQGDIYLRDLLCEVDKTGCPVIPVRHTTKPKLVPNNNGPIHPLGQCFVLVGFYTQTDSVAKVQAALNDVGVTNHHTHPFSTSKASGMRVSVGPYRTKAAAVKERSLIARLLKGRVAVGGTYCPAKCISASACAAKRAKTAK
ncbi:hypothetical protein ACQZV8_13605 [Magnetococcales bacterium HHB-1]